MLGVFRENMIFMKFDFRAYFERYNSMLGEFRIQSTKTRSRVISYGVGNKRIAIKMVPSVNSKESQLLKYQWMILQTLRHPHVVHAYKLKEISNQGSHMQKTFSTALVLEYADHNSLLQYLTSQNVNINTRIQILRGIASGLAYSHSHFIAHRDLKLQNILVCSDESSVTAKICDFGLASLCCEKQKQKLFNQFRGTERYMAPEIWRAREDKSQFYDAMKTDIFAFGVISFAVIIGQMPFKRALSKDSLYRLIIQGKIDDFWSFHQKSLIPLQILHHFKDLFKKLVSLQASERPTAQSLVNHPFFKQL